MEKELNKKLEIKKDQPYDLQLELNTNDMQTENLKLKSEINNLKMIKMRFEPISAEDREKLIQLEV